MGQTVQLCVFCTPQENVGSRTVKAGLWTGGREQWSPFFLESIENCKTKLDYSTAIPVFQ